MFQNYLITALRNFARHKFYSFINIAGLTVGLACAIFIILFVRDQLSYDRWIPGSENLYRVEHTFALPGQAPMPGTQTPYLVPQAMLDQIPEVKARTRFIRNRATVFIGKKQFAETIDSVDPNYFQVIRLPLAAGNPASVFAQPDSAVLSETLARKYFGDAPALGKTITISAEYCDLQGENCQARQYPMAVTGILRDLPHNTQIKADLLIPNTSKADPTSLDAKVNWLHIEGWGYVLLQPGADPGAVTAKLATIIDHAVNLSQRIKMNVPASKIMEPRLVRFRDDHLSTDQIGSSMTPPGSWSTVYGFAVIGVLILLVACFNFTNLATARALVRAREISLRKIVGAGRGQLVVQFLGESVLTAMISLVLALALVEVLLPSFSRFLNTPIQFHYVADWPILLSIIGIGVMVGFLSGIYPALILSGIRPGPGLRNNVSGQSGSGLLRTTLVVLQFAVSIGLGIAVLVVFAQISFARNVELGFQKDGVLVINGDNVSAQQRESLIHALAANPGIAGAAVSDSTAIPFGGSNDNVDVKAPGQAVTQALRVISTSPGYGQVYGTRLLAGRFLSQSHSSDTITQMHGAGSDVASPPYNILVNQAGARQLGYSVADAVGKTIAVHTTPATIVGVIGDIKMEGANTAVAPAIYRYLPAYSSRISVRVRGRDLAATLAFIDRTWRAFAPSVAMERHFLNDDFENQFVAEERQGAIFSLFVGIAIFIASLGLFGLAALSTERRTKEIGIRKSFGAEASDIVLMLLWQFSIPVLFANLIAWPVAYYYLRHWLEGYAYRINLNPLYFVGAGGAALVIAWATVIVHAAHVARANPVHALRYE